MINEINIYIALAIALLILGFSIRLAIDLSK